MKNYMGYVLSAEFCIPLEGVKIISYDKSGSEINVTSSEKDGSWNISVPQEIIKITFKKEGFVQKVISPSNLPNIVRLLEDELIGYQERLWFLPGEKVNAFIHSPAIFYARLYRYGIEKKCIMDIGKYGPSNQQVPDGYFVEEGLSWRKTLSYNIPIEAKPGIYSLQLQNEKGDKFSIPFVVSTSKQNYGKKSKILVLASNTTWQSYNIWGGRSRYRNFENTNNNLLLNRSNKNQILFFLRRIFSPIIPKVIKRKLKHFILATTDTNWTPNDDWVFKKLSIRRPFTNCMLERENVYESFTNHLAGGEWQILAWLEHENIQYNIVSGFELHNDPNLLNNYRAVILSTHCEYWSKSMFQGLKQFFEENGGWVINLSGNTIYREIEYYDDGSTRCISLSFHKSCSDESKILGVRCEESAYASCAPYKVLLPNHWVFQNVHFNNKYTFGESSLNQSTPSKDICKYDPGIPFGHGSLDGTGASGWEVDQLTDTAPEDIHIVAQGLNSNGGADMVVREPLGKRGGLFSASSIVFGGCLISDSRASIIVKNVINRALNKW